MPKRNKGSRRQRFGEAKSRRFHDEHRTEQQRRWQEKHAENRHDGGAEEDKR